MNDQPGFSSQGRSRKSRKVLLVFGSALFVLLGLTVAHDHDDFQSPVTTC